HNRRGKRLVPGGVFESRRRGEKLEAQEIHGRRKAPSRSAGPRSCKKFRRNRRLAFCCGAGRRGYGKRGQFRVVCFLGFGQFDGARRRQFFLEQWPSASHETFSF